MISVSMMVDGKMIPLKPEYAAAFRKRMEKLKRSIFISAAGGSFCILWALNTSESNAVVVMIGVAAYNIQEMFANGRRYLNVQRGLEGVAMARMLSGKAA